MRIFVKKMIRYLSIFFSITLLLSNTNFVLFIDHCNSNQTTFFSLDEKKSCCCNNSASMPKDCCNKTKIVVEKIKDNYTPTEQFNISSTQIMMLAITFTESFIFTSSAFRIQSPFISDSSPPNTPVPLNFLYRVILI